MRIVVLAGTLFALVGVSGEAAAQGAWCTEDMNARNCGFFTLAQCQAAASGNGAYCFANQSVARTAVTEPRKPAKPAKQSR